MVEFSGEGTDECHAEWFLVKVIDSEGGGAEGLDVLHGLVSSGHEGRECLTLLFANVEEAVVGNEVRARLLLDMNFLQLLPHSSRV